MKQINQLFTVASLSSVLLLQVGCSKQEPAKQGASAPMVATTSMGAASSTAAPVANAAEPKAMDMPMAKDVPAPIDKNAVHHVAAVVKAVDTAAGSVTLSHGAVTTLNWPPMTMSFKVKDKMLMDQLAKDKKVEVDFVKDGSDYVVTTVK